MEKVCRVQPSSSVIGCRYSPNECRVPSASVRMMPPHRSTTSGVRQPDRAAVVEGKLLIRALYPNENAAPMYTLAALHALQLTLGRMPRKIRPLRSVECR